MTTFAIAPSGLLDAPDFAMIVDIERNLTGSFPVETALIIEQLDALHTDVWNLFKAAKGPQWNDILEGKP